MTLKPLALTTLFCALLTPALADTAPELTEAGLYDPSPAFPFGRPNPAAPTELQEFAFFIGEFACTDRTRKSAGGWNEFPAIWNGAYFLNGYGIQDQYWAPTQYTSNIRLFDPASGEWKVTYFSAPQARYFSGVWSGGKKGEDMVLFRKTPVDGGGERISRLTFHDITDHGFEWKSETRTDDDFVTGWTSSCRRSR